MFNKLLKKLLILDEKKVVNTFEKGGRPEEFSVLPRQKSILSSTVLRSTRRTLCYLIGLVTGKKL